MASLDANTARATYDLYAATTVFTVAPSLAYADQNLRAGVDGGLSVFESGHTSGVGEANAALGGPIAGAVRWEAGADGAVLWYRATPAVLSGLFTPRVRVDRGPFTGWLGGSLGASNNDSLRGPIAHGSVDTAHAFFVGRGEAGVALTLPHVVPALTVMTTRAGKLFFTDVAASAQGDLGPFGANATVGHRAGDLSHSAATWFNAELRFSVVPGVALVAAAGSYTADPIHGSPGSHFFGGGVRLSDALRIRKRPLGAARYNSLNGASDVMPDARTLRFTAPANAYVEVMGDFTNWQPVVMSQVKPGLYETVLPEVLPSGPHRVNIRVDNGDWTVPRELPPVTDDFGGTAGSLVVP